MIETQLALPTESVPVLAHPLWRDIPALQTTKIGALVNDLKELDAMAADLESRRKSIRDLITEIMKPLGLGTVQVYDRLVLWNPPASTERLDRGMLVKAGVTPDQLAAGTKRGTKAGFLSVRSTKDAPDPAIGD